MAITTRQAMVGAQHFNPADFNAHIASHGMGALYWRGIVCACLVTETGAPDPSCTVCDGIGAHYYEAEPTAISVYATRKLQREAERQGSWLPGIAQFTFPSTIIAKPFDRFEVPSDRIVVDEVFVKGAVNPRTNVSRERMRFPTVLAIEQAEFVMRTPASGVPYTSQAMTLFQDIHFTRVGRQIAWLPAGDDLIPDETTYSVRYLTQATWVVWAPRQRGEHDVVMPGTYECRRLDYVSRQQGGTMEG